MSDDLLSNALDLVHLSGALIFRFDVREPWCVAAEPTFEKFSANLPEQANHVIAFHVVIEGECWLRRYGDKWILAQPGDAIVLPHGGLHELADRRGDDTVPFTQNLSQPKLLDFRHASIERGDASMVSLLCGFLGCDRRAFEPLCASLPDLFCVRVEVGPGSLVDHAVRQATDNTPGAQSVRTRLTEVLFMQALRKYVDDLPADAKGWLAAVHDPVVGRALHVMHAEPCYDWSVQTLAEKVFISRSHLTARFHDVLDQPPMQYLTQLRMQMAARMLDRSSRTLADVAGEVGYDSTAAFQRAFKRFFGVAPGYWRRQARRDLRHL